MNNPFERDRKHAGHSINNPFDNDPASPRNRFPDISQSAASPAFATGASSWRQQPDYYSQFPQQPQQQPQPHQSFAPTATSSYAPSAGSQLSYPSNSPGIFQSSPSPYGTAGFAAGVASGGSYTSPLTSPLASLASPYSRLSPSGSMTTPLPYQTANATLGSPSRTSDANNAFLQSPSLHPQLSQFDPLSPSNSSASTGPQNSFSQPNYPAYSSSTLASQHPSQSQNGLDPGPLVWHARSPSNPGLLFVTGFGGQTTLQIQVRPHSYTANEHPRHVIATHRSELEQWDQYGWRQSLNSLENLRIAWEHLKDDISRITDIGLPPHESAVYRKVRHHCTFQTLINIFRDSVDEKRSDREDWCVLPWLCLSSC